MTDSESVMSPRLGLDVQNFADAMLIWDQAGQRLHHLDQLAALVWEELDGRTIGAIASSLAELFDAPAEPIEADMITLCDRLLAEGLLKEQLRSTTHANGGGQDEGPPPTLS
jgi:hypothetical protein